MKDSTPIMISSSVFQYKSFAAYLAKKAELRKHWLNQQIGTL